MVHLQRLQKPTKTHVPALLSLLTWAVCILLSGVAGSFPGSSPHQPWNLTWTLLVTFSTSRSRLHPSVPGSPTSISDLADLHGSLGLMDSSAHTTSMFARGTKTMIRPGSDSVGELNPSALPGIVSMEHIRWNPSIKVDFNQVS